MCEKLDEGFADSDDEEGSGKKKPKKSGSDDKYANSLIFKSGRNSNTSLYYTDHSKLKNNGNGLEPDARNDLLGEKGKAELEETTLKADIAKAEAETKKLLSEPTNEEAAAKLQKEEAEMSVLREKVQDARKLKVNEKHKMKTKRNIDAMTAQWRKRKRLSLDFLIVMEESTEGTITMKKCLSGDGQIDIESDAKCISDTVEFAKKKKKRAMAGGKTFGKRGSGKASQQIPADENFIGVKLGSKGESVRVYMEVD